MEKPKKNGKSKYLYRGWTIEKAEFERMWYSISQDGVLRLLHRTLKKSVEQINLIRDWE